MAQLTPQKPFATPNKHGFDNSQRHVFSCKPGQLIPIPVADTIPNSEYEIKPQNLLRTLNMNTAAFMRASQTLDFFFVPYSQLFTRFNQFFAQRHDPVTAGSKLPTHLPNFNLFELLASVSTFEDDNDDYQDMFGFSLRSSFRRVLDMLGYGDAPIDVPFTYLDESDIDPSLNIRRISPQWIEYLTHIGIYVPIAPEGGYTDEFVFNLFYDFATSNYYGVTPFRAAAYQKIWNDFYRNPYRDEPLDPAYFNFDDIPCDDVSGENSKIADYREWTQFTDIFELRYRRWKNDIYTSSYPSAQYGNASFVSMQLSSIRGTANISNPELGSVQNNQYHQAPIRPVNTLDFDKVNVNDGFFDDGDQHFWVGPNVSKSDITFNNVLRLNSSNDFNGTNISTINGLLAVSPISGSNNVGVASFTIAQLRTAIAMQHWAENVIRAGNRTSDNFKAHFGVEPVYDNDMHVKFLGSVQSRVDMNIVSTTGNGSAADGSDKSLGSLTANGIASFPDETFTYRAKDFGVIMAVYSILPEAEYNSIICDKSNRKIEPFDFPNTELDDIGFQPIFNDDLRRPSSSNLVLGYAFPYWEYKTAVDKVHGEFQRLYFDDDRFTTSWQKYSGVINGSMADYTSPRTQMQLTSSAFIPLPFTTNMLYVNPHVFDTIFGVAADSKQNTDSFKVNLYLDVKSRLPLSVLGLPQY